MLKIELFFEIRNAQGEILKSQQVNSHMQLETFIENYFQENNINSEAEVDGVYRTTVSIIEREPQQHTGPEDVMEEFEEELKEYPVIAAVEVEEEVEEIPEEEDEE